MPDRALRQARAVAAVLALLLLALPWLCIRSRRIECLAWKLLLAGFGVRLRCHGTPDATGSALTVANHISWTDIAVLGRLLDAGFVAKSEIAGWPIIGALTRRYGCPFIARDSRTATHRLAADMNAYPADHSLVLFAEGTTGLGDVVLPFHSGLFAASERWPRVQPVTIAYRRADGAPLSPAERRAVAWVDDDALLPHALALAASGGITVDVWFEESFAPHDRKHAAQESRRRIAARLVEVQAAALKRAA
ncbi:lysophospholipid acyltransferase family protein [Novosphingobium sp. JCM 18896]|uniref:lysophospholipid acyltransferase family protein n=1 Tax=Novosphingobium sp. JCM 18896 TaxID=2989731 RepID=UPI00222228DF|nr:lysophospholipid acyltransferase family protein [Novosphingobium sp. JCM 18896]MCW1428708.1 1-acyl-sn-glycerol-3-phosphate acyltransferase [Novosphingobium sp. JCM 18896]